MKIIELYIEEFGAIKDLHIKPDEGITVIAGENESGKSTVWAFIKFILYGLAKRGSTERERAISRSGHRAAGRMLVQKGGEVYQINRSVIEGGRTSEAISVVRTRDGEKVFQGEIPGEAILGVPKEVFENSCAVGQSMCAGVSGKKEANAIQNLLTSADESETTVFTFSAISLASFLTSAFFSVTISFLASAILSASLFFNSKVVAISCFLSTSC